MNVDMKKLSLAVAFALLGSLTGCSDALVDARASGAAAGAGGGASQSTTGAGATGGGGSGGQECSGPCKPKATHRIAVSGLHTCAVTTDGGARCWGDNSAGQLGIGTTKHSAYPVAVEGLMAPVAEVATGELHTCATTPSGEVRCWGDNHFGQLGDGTQTARLEPGNAVPIPSAVVTSAGGEHTCVLGPDGALACWGRNDVGQLGDGSWKDSSSPAAPTGLAQTSTMIAAGYLHTCALSTSGGVRCWGYNADGQLGDGTTKDGNEPVNVAGLSSGVVAIAAGYRRSCALLSEGGVSCWGGGSLVPTAVPGLATEVASMAVGIDHVCILTTKGAVQCWGSNQWGALGDGSGADSDVPVNVEGLDKEVVELEAADAVTCALLTTGKIKCWGLNNSGQLGDGTLEDRAVPADVFGF